MLNIQPHLECFVGNNVSRVEDDKLIHGKGQFGSDALYRPDALHAVVLRSEHAAAKIKITAATTAATLRLQRRRPLLPLRVPLPRRLRPPLLRRRRQRQRKSLRRRRRRPRKLRRLPL